MRQRRSNPGALPPLTFRAMSTRLTRACVSSAIVLLPCASPSQVTFTNAPPGVSDGDWPSYNRTRAGDRYSPLTEINTGNVAQLRTLCRYTLPEGASLQTGPLVVAGTMYFTTDTISYAIDAGNYAEQGKAMRHSETPSVMCGYTG